VRIRVRTVAPAKVSQKIRFADPATVLSRPLSPGIFTPTMPKTHMSRNKASRSVAMAWFTPHGFAKAMPCAFASAVKLQWLRAVNCILKLRVNLSLICLRSVKAALHTVASDLDVLELGDSSATIALEAGSRL